MKTSDFSYYLPNELIARYPMEKRSASRLLVVSETGELTHTAFHDFGHFLQAGDLVVLNNTKVIAARLFGKKTSGGQIEILVERVESEFVVLAHVRSSRSPKSGARLDLYTDETLAIASSFYVSMIERKGSLFRLEFSAPVLDVLQKIGHMPLPPYIDRADEKMDQDRYQTVFAKNFGAVAAPTAGLHFDTELLAELKAKGVEFTEVTLHVGAGTFQPVKVENIHEHVMHSEWLQVTEETCEKVRNAKKLGHRIVAIGTTAVRSLETASASGEIKAYSGDTTIFIYPGYRFNCVDMMITNFHLPESTLLMLVSAFSGIEEIRNAYKEAIKERYRFFSYGDAMLLFKKMTHEI